MEAFEIESPEIRTFSEGFAHEEQTRANWRPDPEILAAASEPKRDALKTALGMPAVPSVVVAEHIAHTRSTVPPPMAVTAESAPRQPMGDASPPATSPEHGPGGRTLPLAQPVTSAPAVLPDPAGARQRTMLGVAMPGVAPSAPEPVPAPPPRAAPLGTLLGVAMPGVAPAGPQAPTAPSSDPVVAPLGARSNRTLLGVTPASPTSPNAGPPRRGQDPLSPGVLTAAFKIPDVLPAPAPPQREALPEAPVLTPKRGLPVAPVVGGIAVALALGGVGLFFALKSAPPLTAQGRVDESGKEALSVRCPTCPDGTKLSLRGAAVDVKAGEAILPLSEPLALGPNEFQVVIDRPSKGRDETVKLSVPVSYRVRADLGSLDADPPAIVIRAEAVAGSTVEIDGKPLALTTGKGQAVFPLGDDVLGPSDESKVVDRSLTFKVVLTDPSRTEGGTLPVRVRVVPLHLDAPGAHAVVAGGTTCRFTGQTVVGGKLTVNGLDATLGSRGEFSADVPCANLGPHLVTIVAHMPGFASRKATVVVTKVSSLDAEAKAWEAKPLVAEGALTKPESVGKPSIVEGEVVDVRVINGLAIALVDNRRGCKSNCLVRVLYGGGDGLTKGQSAKVYGVVTRTVTADGKTVPEVDAAFVERKLK